MINLQEKVQYNFNNASKSYDIVAKIQCDAANSLVSKLIKIKDFNPETILDLGTGTGNIPELLISAYPRSRYLLNDVAQEMLEACKSKFALHPNFTFLKGDMTTLEVKTHDLVISNLALQWVDDLWQTLKIFLTKSSKVFAFTTLLEGTFQEWQSIINQYQDFKIHNYPTNQELVKYCNAIKDNFVFNYWTMDMPISFSNPLEFMHYLKLLGASASNSRINLSKLRVLLREQNKPLTVTYRIFFGIFRKI